MPPGIPVDIPIVRDRLLDPLVEAVPRLDRQSLPQLGILLLKILQMKRNRVHRRALGEVDIRSPRLLVLEIYLLNWPRVGVLRAENMRLRPVSRSQSPAPIKERFGSSSELEFSNRQK